MKIFHLPDLGEGLAEAEIREWHVKIGDIVKVDQPLVCMETAKAVVEVPSPYAGKISKLHGKPGDIIPTDAPLVEFEEDELPAKKDSGTVVGNLEESHIVMDAGDVIIGAAKHDTTSTIKAMPAVRALAKKWNIDLHLIQPTGQQGQITAEDVKKFIDQQKQNTATSKSASHLEPLHGVRRAMAIAMTQSHQQVVPVTLVDDVDISDFQTDADITVRIIQAMIAGIQKEPSLNAWYEGKSMERCVMDEIHIGLAMDTPEGLFVPVLKKVNERSSKELRDTINHFKKSVRDRTIAASDLQGATISLSNFGTIAGRYANPIILPPMVAILGCGKIRDEVVARDGTMMIRRILPLSLTIDHRAVTGGEASRFLFAVIQHLEGKE